MIKQFITKNMKDRSILLLSWLLTALALVLFIPRNKIREATLSFFFKQFITWVFGLIVVHKKLIKYPVRLFKSVTKSSFTFEYFVFPSICTFFNIYYPQQANIAAKISYHVVYSAFITIIEYVCERYTNLIKYTNWRWYHTFITISFTFYLSRLYYQWFLKGFSKKSTLKENSKHRQHHYTTSTLKTP